MIYTVTFNPAIDYVVHVSKMKTGCVNRAQSETIQIGGKGINVSIVLHALGVRSKALGFIAGFTGAAIAAEMEKRGIETDFVPLEGGFSRINVKVQSEEETELNGQGPNIDDAAVAMLFAKLDACKDGDTLVLAGSIPSTLPPDMYERILQHCSHKKIRTVVDATKDLLRNVLPYKPFLIKPNHHELGELFGKALTTEQEILLSARKLQEMGARNVLVSMAAEGALLLDETGAVHRCAACKGTLQNSIGAGDSMVAGFLAGYDNGSYEDALKLGTAAGGATAFSEGLATKEAIVQLLQQM